MCKDWLSVIDPAKENDVFLQAPYGPDLVVSNSPDNGVTDQATDFVIIPLLVPKDLFCRLADDSHDDLTPAHVITNWI